MVIIILSTTLRNFASKIVINWLISLGLASLSGLGFIC